MLCACLGCRQSYCWRNTAYPGVRLDSSSPSSQVVSREVPNVTEEELRNNLQQLQTLIPDLKPGPTSKFVWQHGSTRQLKFSSSFGRSFRTSTCLALLRPGPNCCSRTRRAWRRT
ncbi:hypothetical protein Vretifemale_322 [Volvox reticuliferus]|uniref:Uncharacterized protein n=1 Tax=Volvox reticuliferus TaxID=1737510 RepID=A0A8J4BTY8_9CHLO|nr:hypothetical protein Vretifemale_322 [Volvox reticuliferus]